MIFSSYDVLITGATGGIGRAVAEEFWRQGAVVHLVGRRSEILQEIAQGFGQRCHIYPVDLMQPGAPQNLLKQIQASGSNIHILVNNSGITRDKLSLRMKEADWSDVLNLNLKVPFELCQGVLPFMLRNKFGRIINISSIVGVMGNAGQTNYVASKAGLIGLTKALALEVAKKAVTVNAVAPGFIETDMTSHLADKQQWASKIPVGYFGSPLDVAYGVVFLADPKSRYITGQTLHINGGLLAV